MYNIHTYVLYEHWTQSLYTMSSGKVPLMLSLNKLHIVIWSVDCGTQQIGVHNDYM